MGRSQLVSAGLTAPLLVLLLLLGACGEPDSLLVPADVSGVYGEGGAFGPSSYDPAEFGTIEGTVTFKGKPLRQGDVPLSDEFCVNANPNGLASEDFRFDPETGALEGVYVYLSKGVNKKLEDLHPVPTEPIILDQIGCRYVPHQVMLRVGQPLVFKSSDATLHNVMMAPGRGDDGFNEIMNSPGTLKPKVFDLPESEPRSVQCSVHGWMRANVSILRHPYCALTGKDGKFRIEGVPPGSYEVTFWHERSNILTPVRITVEVKPSESVTADHQFVKG